MDGRAVERLDQLLDQGWAPRLGLGGISVLHAGNVHRSVEMFEHFARRSLAMRFLPVFAMVDPPPRMRHLMLSPEQIVEALWEVMQARLQSPTLTGTRVYPLDDYLRAAVVTVSGGRQKQHDPEQGEWTLIVDTDGTVYTHSDAYLPGAALGNGFRQPLAELMRSTTRRGLIADRRARSRLCAECPHSAGCNGLPMIEAVPSERIRDHAGQLRCGVARPLIDRMVALIRAVPGVLPSGLRATDGTV